MEADRLADLADGRGVAVLGGVLADEVEDLLLALGQIHGQLAPSLGSWRVEHTFVIVDPLADGCKPDVASRGQSRTCV
jgi:hypothetical protein